MGFTEEERLQAIENMRDDIDLFSRTCTPGALTSETPDFHREMDNVYKAKFHTKILIVAPRNHAKSTKAGLAWVLHHILYDEGKKVIVLVSKTQKHAIRLLSTIKYALDGDESENIKYFFQDHLAINDSIKDNSKKWTDAEIKLSDDTLIVALGTGQQIRGTKEGYLRPTFILVDDPEDEENTKTVDAMTANFDWVMGGAVPALADNGRIIIIGTVIHKYCIVKRLEKAKGWTKLWYQAIQEDGKTVLWPSRWPLDRLLRLKAEYASVGKLALWYKEYQNKIVAPEDQPFQESMWEHRWKGDMKHYKDERITELIHKINGEWWLIPVYLYAGIDPARSKESTADYSAIKIFGIDHEGHAWSVYTHRERYYPIELANKILEVAKIYPLRGINIETVGYQDMLRDYLKNQKLWLPGIERKNEPRTAKNDRLMGMQPRFSNGGVTLLEEQDDVFIGELEEFNPAKRNNRDDLMDAAWYALKDIRNCPYPARLARINYTYGNRQKRKQSTKNNWLTQ